MRRAAMRTAAKTTGNASLPPPCLAAAPAIDPGMPAQQAFVSIAESCLRHLQGNAGPALASDDPEYIHQMRVAVRRLRTALQLFRPALPAGFAARWNGAWRELAQLLGQARNWDVFASEVLPPLAAAFPGHREVARLAEIGAERLLASRQAVRAEIGGSAYRRRLTHFVGEIAALAGGNGEGEKGSGKGETGKKGGKDEKGKTDNGHQRGGLPAFAVRRLARRAKRVGGLAGEAGGLDADGRHRLRIACKKLRYALEFFAPLLPARRLRAYRQRLVRLQETLGELNDLAMAADLLTSAGVAGDGLAAGWLAGRHELLARTLAKTVERFLGKQAPRAPWR